MGEGDRGQSPYQNLSQRSVPGRDKLGVGGQQIQPDIHKIGEQQGFTI